MKLVRNLAFGVALVALAIGARPLVAASIDIGWLDPAAALAIHDRFPLLFGTGIMTNGPETRTLLLLGATMFLVARHVRRRVPQDPQVSGRG
jgi:hypothetical protein